MAIGIDQLAYIFAIDVIQYQDEEFLARETREWSIERISSILELIPIK
jgi:hypothetical protein